MAERRTLRTQPAMKEGDSRGLKSSGSLDAETDLILAEPEQLGNRIEGKILQANDAVSQLLGFRQDEVLEQSLSRFITPDETREFTVALREVVERGVMRNVVLNPRSASGEVIPTSLNASALRNPDGQPIGVIQIDTLNQRSRFTDSDLEVLASVASQAAVSIDNAKMHEQVIAQRAMQRDLELARRMQRALLPAKPPQVPGYYFFDYYQAAREVGSIQSPLWFRSSFSRSSTNR